MWSPTVSPVASSSAISRTSTSGSLDRSRGPCRFVGCVRSRQSPAASTRPAPSTPRIFGLDISFHAMPWRTPMSMKLTPATVICTSTIPRPGTGSGRSKYANTSTSPVWFIATAFTAVPFSLPGYFGNGPARFDARDAPCAVFQQSSLVVVAVAAIAGRHEDRPWRPPREWSRAASIEQHLVRWLTHAPRRSRPSRRLRVLLAAGCGRCRR
jgi:hypothetical protein